jgi:hypothetical protein
MLFFSERSEQMAANGQHLNGETPRRRERIRLAEQRSSDEVERLKVKAKRNKPLRPSHLDKPIEPVPPRQRSSVHIDDLFGLRDPIGPAPQDDAIKINAAWGKTLEAAVNVGKMLIELKAKRGHGHFMRVFNDLEFSLRTGNYLMQIAQHPVLSNSQHFANLPKAWTTVHALTPLPAEETERLIAEGKIHSRMTRKDAELVSGLPPSEKLIELLRTLARITTLTTPAHLYEHYAWTVQDGGTWNGLGKRSAHTLGDLITWLTELKRCVDDSRVAEESDWDAAPAKDEEQADDGCG